MRKKIVFTCFGFILLHALNAQQERKANDTAFYNLVLPKRWQDNNFLFNLTGLIQDNIPLLKDKKVCLNCTGLSYNISFFIQPPKAFEHLLINVTKVYETNYDKYEYNIAYYLFASLCFKGKNNEIIGEMIVVDSTEIFRQLKVFNTPSTQTPIDYAAMRKIQNGNFYRPTAPGINRTAFLFDRERFIKDHEKEMLPDEKELCEMIQSRIYTYRNIVRK